MELANQLYGASSNSTELEEPTGSTEPTVQTEAEAEPRATEEPETATPTSDRIVKAELDGREVELKVLTDDIDLDLIPKSLLMEKAFRQKTMALAEDRRAVEEKINSLDQKLLDLSEQIDFDLRELESDEYKELQKDDPDEFEKLRLKAEKKISKFKAFQEERTKEISAQQQAMIEADREKVPDLIPEWLDEKVVRKDVEKIGNYLKSYGVPEDQLERILSTSGSVSLATLRKAALYDEIQAAPVNKNLSRKASKTSSPNSATSQDAAPKREQTYAEILYGK